MHGVNREARKADRGQSNQRQNILQRELRPAQNQLVKLSHLELLHLKFQNFDRCPVIHLDAVDAQSVASVGYYPVMSDIYALNLKFT